MTRPTHTTQPVSIPNASQDRRLTTGRNELPAVLTQNTYRKNTRPGTNYALSQLDQPLQGAGNNGIGNGIDLQIPLEPQVFDHLIHRVQPAQSTILNNNAQTPPMAQGPVQSALHTAAAPQSAGSQPTPQPDHAEDERLDGNIVSISVVHELVRKHCDKILQDVKKELGLVNGKVDALEEQLKVLCETGSKTSELLNAVALSFGTNGQSKKSVRAHTLAQIRSVKRLLNFVVMVSCWRSHCEQVHICPR